MFFKKKNSAYGEVILNSNRWRVRVYDRLTSKILHDVDGVCRSDVIAKKQSQKKLRKLLNGYRG